MAIPTANLLTGLNIDEIFRRTDSQGARDFITDALGSTLALTDGTGTIQTRYIYDPFGGTTTSGQASTNSFQYTGRENDGTGLYYYRARYYSPQFQRFVSEDPIGFGGGDVNLMRYVYNNPMRFIDPLGFGAAGVAGGIMMYVGGTMAVGGVATWNPILFYGGLGVAAIGGGLTLYDPYLDGEEAKNAIDPTEKLLDQLNDIQEEKQKQIDKLKLFPPKTSSPPGCP